MSNAQWMMEYDALVEKENATQDLISTLIKIFKDMLVSILGLNLLNKDDNKDMFIPLSIFTGRREIVEAIFKNIEDQQQAEAAIEDDKFNKLSEAIAKGEIGDMDPILTPSIDENLIKEQIRNRELESIGVKITEQEYSVPHIDFDIKKTKQRIKKTLSGKITFEEPTEK